MIVLSVVACLIIAPLVSFGQPQSASAMALAQTGSMPTWTIPVLRLVSATHVEPTTGVVIADSGLVIVPADFASFGDEIIVLDGGTDIIRNGRPAKIVQRFAQLGLQVLSVETLKRRGAAISASPVEDGSPVRLLAFPPAEMIAKGEPSLNIETRVTVLSENGRPVISAQNPLPNVSGALVDDCGNLAGYSTASGVQSMSTSESPGYTWKEDLKNLMLEMQIEPKVADCGQVSESAAVAETAPQVPEPEPEEAAQPDAQEPDPEPLVVEDSSPVEPPGELVEAATEEIPPEADEVGLEEMELLPPVEDESMPGADSDAPAADDGADKWPAWLWLLAAALLFVAGWTVHRTRTRKALQTIPDTGRTVPAVGSDDSDEVDETGVIGDGLDDILTIDGQLADGTPFSTSCRVNSHAINLVIGRGNEDININSATVSRRHASLNGARDMLTISDLGSSNGTSINGVPCLEGETMFIQPGDIIILGNCRFSFQVTAGQQAPE